MQISTYTGEVVSNRGPGKSEETLILEGALKTCLMDGIPQRIHIGDGENRRRVVYRLRNLAQANKLSCQLRAPADNHNDIVIFHVQARDGSPLSAPVAPPKKVPSRTSAPPQKRTRK